MEGCQVVLTVMALFVGLGLVSVLTSSVFSLEGRSRGSVPVLLVGMGCPLGQDGGVDLGRVDFSWTEGQLVVDFDVDLCLFEEYGSILAEEAVLVLTGFEGAYFTESVLFLADEEGLVGSSVEGVAAVGTSGGLDEVEFHRSIVYYYLVIAFGFK